MAIQFESHLLLLTFLRDALKDQYHAFNTVIEGLSATTT